MRAARMSVRSRLASLATGVAARALPLVSRREHRLLFAFQGGSPRWLSLAPELYRSEDVVRTSIDSSSAVVADLLGFSAAAALRGEWQPPTFELERQHELVQSGLLQLALVDWWRAAGVSPAGVLGGCMGEVNAAYCSGVLSLEAAATVISSIAKRLEHQDTSTILFSIALAPADAIRLCSEAPHRIGFVGETVSGVSLLDAPVATAQQARAFLERHARVLLENHTTWRYHLPDVAFDSAGMKRDLEEIIARPPALPTFLSSLGARAPHGHAFNGTQWERAVTGTFSYGGAVTAAISEGFDRVILLGPQSVLSKWIADTARPLSREVQVLDTFKTGRTHSEKLQHAARKVRALRLTQQNPE
jgi:acyl transferase domain-containing protein